MRTLKRTLCLVLAMVMVLGMFGIASATSFKDDAKVQYKEAVDVMTGIGSINGMGDGTFNPAGNVTRAQAAKMVAYAVLGADVAKNLPVTASSFKDVDSNFNWATPSIEYLVKKGVINGRGDGTFDPNGNITAYEIAKMLLCAAGYGKNGEYTGNSWALNVAITAQKKGVFTGSKAGDRNEAATREECALYCFNGLTKVAQVAYNKNTSTYDPTTAGTIADDVYDYGTTTAAAAAGLAKVAGSVNGQSGYYWYYKNATTPISAFITDEAVIGSSYDGTALTTLTTYSTTNAKYIAALATDVTYIVNGKVYSPYDAAATYALNATVNYGGKLYHCTTAITTAEAWTVGHWTEDTMPAGYGVLYDFVDTNDDTKTAEKVYITKYTVDVIAAAPVVKTNPADGKDYVFIDMGTDIGGAGAIDYSVKAANVDGYADLAKGDVVIVYTMANGTYKLVKAETFTGKVTASTASTLTIGDTTYKFAVSADATITTYAFGYQKDVVFYKDSYGYLVYAKATTTATTNYLMVLKTGDFTSDPISGDTNKASVVFDDGTTGVITVSSIYDAVTDPANPVTYSWAAGTLVAGKKPADYAVLGYVKLEDGTYALVSKTTVSGTDNFTKGVATSSTDTIIADANTVFVMRDKSGASYLKTYTVYTGFAAFPGFTGTTNYYAINGADGKADAVFVYNYDAATAADTGVFYLLGTTPTAVYGAGGVVSYYTFPALVNGQQTTVKSASADLTQYDAGTNTDGINKTAVPLTAGMLCHVSYTDGMITANSVTPVTAATEGALNTAAGSKNCFDVDTVIGTPANGVIAIGTKTYSYTDSTYVFTISADHQTVTPGLISSVVPGTYASGVTVVTVAATLDAPANATPAQENTIYAIFIQQ